MPMTPEDETYWKSLFGEDYLAGWARHWRNLYRGNDAGNGQKPKKKPNNWWPGKPETDQQWLHYAREKLETPGVVITFDPIRAGPKRGFDIMNRIQGNGATFRSDCGCETTMDDHGIEYFSPCSDHRDR